MNFRRNLISSTAAAVLTLALIPLASAQTVLKASDVHPAGYPNVVAIENMGKKLEAATGGRYKLQMFAGGVLGSEKEVVEQTQIGAIQIARISLGILGPVVPDVNVFNMPFVFRNIAHMRAVIDGPFAETRELVAGYWLWQVKDMDEAVAWVKRCPNPMPGKSEIEIRPIFEMSDFGEALTPEVAALHERNRAETTER